MNKAKDFFYRATLGQTKLDAVGQQDAGYHEADDVVRAWLVASLPYDYFSFKQLRTVVENFTERLCKINPALTGQLGLVKFTLRNKCREFIETETDRLAEIAFDRLLEKGQLCFYLECVECRFQLPSSVEIRRKPRLRHNDDSEVAKHCSIGLSATVSMITRRTLRLYWISTRRCFGGIRTKLEGTASRFKDFGRIGFIPILSYRTAKTRSRWRELWLWKARAGISPAIPTRNTNGRLLVISRRWGKRFPGKNSERDSTSTSFDFRFWTKGFTTVGKMN